MKRTYNTFFAGDKQDDFLTGGANLIDSKNLTGLRTGYGITLGNLSEKVLGTLGKPYSMYLRELSTGGLSQSWAGDDLGNIYRMDGADNTPSYSLVTYAGNSITNIMRFGLYSYFFHQDITNTTCRIARILTSEINQTTPDWSTVDENWESFSTIDNPPILIYGNVMYIGGLGQIIRIDETSQLRTDYNFPQDYIIGFSLSGTTIKVYERTGNVYYWNGNDDAFSSSQDYEFRIQATISIGGVDYITSEDGDYYAVSGYAQPTRITKAELSLRLEDNSSYQSKLDFTKNAFNGINLESSRGDVYITSNNDSNPGIYKFGRLIPGVQPGMHKIISNNYNGDDIDEFYDIEYYERTLSSLFFGYDVGGTYTIDKIDVKGLTTTSDGYGVTDVFAGGTIYDKKIKHVKVGYSYTGNNNTVNVYYRINNGSWELLRTLTGQDTIKTVEITKTPDGKALKQFVDIQFKVELHNDTNSNTPPILHELTLDYDIIKE